MLTSRLRTHLFAPLALLAFTLYAAPSEARQYQSDGHSFGVTPVPGWVDWAKLPSESPARPGQAVAYRLVDRQVNITTQGTTQFTRLVTEPLTEAGLHDAAVIEIEFNPAFQQLNIHKLSLSRNGHTMDKLRPDQVHLIQREQDFDDYMYEGIITATIVVDDVRLKDSIDLSYSVEGRNPVFGGKYFAAFALGWSESVDLARVRVSAPAGRKLYTRAFNATVKPEVRRSHGRVEYRWSATHTPAVLEDDDAPIWHQPYPAIQVSEYRNWREVADWANKLYPHGSRLPPELEATVKTWRKQTKDKKQLVARALKLVQDQVRYFGIELGQNSHRPTAPARVYERRYGDCKDKATLLVALLADMGIKAWPALVSTDHQRDIDNWLPTPGVFDHVIVTTKLDGKRYWLDGTRNYQHGSLDTLSVPDFERALIVKRGEDRLTPIVVSDSTAPAIDTEEEFRVTDYSKPVTLAVKTTYRGALAETMREYFATNTPDAITRSYMNFYAKMYPSISSAGNVSSKDDPDNNRFITEEHYRVENFWEDDDGGISASLIGSSIAPYIKRPDTVRRSSPLAITYPVSVRQSCTLIYPEDIDYEVDHPEIKIEDRFVRFHRAVSYGNRKLTVSYDYSTRKDNVMPADLPHYLKDLNKIGNTLEYSTRLESNTAPASKVRSMVDTLLNRLDGLSSH